MAKWNESSTLIPKIDELLKKQDKTYTDLSHIIIVRWPGSFTGVRTSVLVANTLAYSLWIQITGLSFFDLFDNYPIIKASSRRDCFIQKSSESEIEILTNDTIQEYVASSNIQQLYGEIIDIFDDTVSVFDKIDYESILQHISLDTLDRIEPLYIKRPNIS